MWSRVQHQPIWMFADLGTCLDVHVVGVSIDSWGRVVPRELRRVEALENVRPSIFCWSWISLFGLFSYGLLECT